MDRNIQSVCLLLTVNNTFETRMALNKRRFKNYVAEIIFKSNANAILLCLETYMSN